MTAAAYDDDVPPGDEERRPLPQDIQAEQSVLGGMLLSQDAIADVTQVLRGRDFYRPAHELIHDVIVELDSKGQPVDAVTVAAELTRRGAMQRVGGAPYLHTLISTVPTAANAGYYAGLVREQAVLRRMVEAGTRIVQLGHTPDGGPAEERLALARGEVDACEGLRVADERSLLDLATELLDDLENPPDAASLVSCPWATGDQVLAPLQPGQLVVVGARPSVGKSVLAVDWCRHVAFNMRRPAVLCSLEMERKEVVRRLVAAQARVALDRLTPRLEQLGLDEDEWSRVSKVMAEVADARLIVDDSPDVGVGHVRLLVRRHRPALVAVDYLGLMATGRAESREQAVGETVRQLKQLAKTEQLPVLLLVQLNRALESRADKRPHMADLRESGQVEAHADVILLLHRPELYDRDDRPGEVDVIVAKQRNGPTGTITLGAQLHYSRFVDLAGGWR